MSTRALLLALVVSILVAALVEAAWRRQGAVPTVIDSPELWAYTRDRALDDERAIFLVGASRIQLNIDTETLRRRFPGRPFAQLALNGKCGPPVLEHLAARDDVRGTVIMSTYADCLLVENRKAEKTLTAAEKSWPWDRIEARVEAELEGRVALRNPMLEPITALQSIVALHRPPNAYTSQSADRSIRQDFQELSSRGLLVELTNSRLMKAKARPPVEKEAFLNGVQRLKPVVDRLKSRGVRVVFVRMPSSGEHWRIDEARTPRARYWDQIGPLLDIDTIHFKDFATLDAFEAPDTSHLDMRDAPAFTDALLDVLVSLGAL